MNRYIRQQQVPQLGDGSQDLLSAARVLLVGLGGLGSPVGSLLAGAGVGSITLVDFDTVDLTNLHRQTLYTEADIGQSKAVNAKRTLEAINSEISVRSVEAKLSTGNAEPLVTQHTVVVDAADSFFVSYLLSDLCRQHNIPLVSASVLQTSGYVGVFCGSNDFPAPSLRAIFPSPPLTAQTCSTAGVTGPSVAAVGSIQAQEVLKVILRDTSQLNGKILNLDLWNYQQNIVDFSHAAEPALFAPLISDQTIDTGDTMLDVRTEAEVQASPRQVNSGVALINIPVDQLAVRYNELAGSGRIVCVCKSGQRALNAANQLIKLGLQNIAVAL